MSKLFYAPLCALMLVIGLSGCSKSDDDESTLTDSNSDLMVQQIGDSMTSIDESGGNNNGNFSYASFLEVSCNGVSFGACNATASATAVKEYNGCTIFGGLASVSGTVTLTYSGSGSGTCTIPMVGDSVSRVPAFTATLSGNNNGSFTASAVSTGQTLTRTGSGTFTFNNAGIHRVYTGGNGSVIADLTTSTTSDITISGTTRMNRVVNGGAVQVVDNKTGDSCTVSPTNVTWASSTCLCPTSGAWTGTCSNGDPISITFTATCGRVDTVIGTTSRPVTLEHCQ